MMLRLLVGSFVLWILAANAYANSHLAYVHKVPVKSRSHLVVLDVRPIRDCLKRTVSGARCLPAIDFLGPHGRLVSFRHILWVLGSIGLSGKETVLVVGNHPRVRDFVAGILYLAGQNRVEILTRPLSDVQGFPAGTYGDASRVPGPIRNPVFQGSVRENLIVLRGELARSLRSPDPPILLDGRTPQEYWGVSIRAQRGGHIPGARRLPAKTLRFELKHGHVEVPPVHQPVVYANDPFSSISYFSLLTATTHLQPRVYIGGWVSWAADGALPADSVSYPSRSLESSSKSIAPLRRTINHSSMKRTTIALMSLIAVMGLIVLSYFLGRRRSNPRTLSVIALWLVAAALLVALPGIGYAQSQYGRRLSVEFEIMLGNVQLMHDPDISSIRRVGLHERLVSSLSYLGITARRYLDEDGIQNPRLLNDVQALRKSFVQGRMTVFQNTLQHLISRYPVDFRGMLPLRVDSVRVKVGRHIYRQECMGCHMEPKNGLMFPAPNLFREARTLPRKEFGARLLGGVVGNFYTSMDNPLSVEQLASLFAYFVTVHQPGH